LKILSDKNINFWFDFLQINLYIWKICKEKESVMNKDNNSTQTSISKAGSLEEIAEFWDTHSLDDYWDQTHEVEFEVRAKRRPPDYD